MRATRILHNAGAVHNRRAGGEVVLATKTGSHHGGARRAGGTAGGRRRAAAAAGHASVGGMRWWWRSWPVATARAGGAARSAARQPAGRPGRDAGGVRPHIGCEAGLRCRRLAARQTAHAAARELPAAPTPPSPGGRGLAGRGRPTGRLCGQPGEQAGAIRSPTRCRPDAVRSKCHRPASRGRAEAAGVRSGDACRPCACLDDAQQRQQQHDQNDDQQYPE